MYKKILAASAITVTAFFAAPLAAHAAGYVPESSITVSDTTPAPGESSTVGFTDGAFTGSETVNFSVTGSGTATLAVLKAATVSLSKTASASGAVSVTVTLPADATGTYTLTATGVTSGNVGTASLSVIPADSSSTGSGSGSTGLPTTGGELPMALLWAVGGLIALGAGFVAVRVFARRQQNQA